MAGSPTQRSLEFLREAGYSAQVVERWNPYARVRVDLFGWIDIVAVHPGIPGVLGVQTTTASNISARRQKARGIAPLAGWLACGGRLALHGWAKRKGRWIVTSEALTVDSVRGTVEA